MMGTTVTIPDFDFGVQYYPQILEALMAYKRRNVPELTDESAYEPLIQMMRSFALVGHLNNTLLDMVANEATLPTAKLTESVRNMLRLIDYELSPASPANVDVIYELSKVFSTPFEMISRYSQVATVREGTNPVIFFEALTALTVARSDQHTIVYSCEDGVFTDRTTAANSSDPADDFQPWATPAMKDAIYWGHTNLMWDTLSVTLAIIAQNIIGVWEYYDGEWSDTAPNSVTDIGGGQLQFDLTSLLGTANRQGTIVKVQLNQTTAYQEVESTWTGSANVVVTGLLGQTSPSANPIEYSVGTQWKALNIGTDEVDNFTGNGKLQYALPQSLTQNWRPSPLNGGTMYWMRYRIISVSTPVPPTIRLTRMDEGKQYALRICTQGRYRTDSPLGSSTGLANQRFATFKDYFVNGSEEVSVDGVVWTRAKNFLTSIATDRHYTVELGENDRATIVFGDGVNGKIPPLGVGNISAAYRYGANDNGNVGANTVTVDKTGLTFINKIWNPRQGNGWGEAQGASAASLEKAKIQGPSSLRTREVAIGPDDVEKLAIAFVDPTGSIPYARARAFEEGYGPKTIELVLVVKGGGAANSTQVADIEEYFNGNPYKFPPIEKHLVANQQVVATNYTPRLIDITATVYGDVEVAVIVNRLNQILQPDALRPDGVTYEWDFGSVVSTSRLNHEIFGANESITDVHLAMPASDVALEARELPKIGTLSITVITP
jgi:predicted phage baseplate assembly protein